MKQLPWPRNWQLRFMDSTEGRARRYMTIMEIMAIMAIMTIMFKNTKCFVKMEIIIFPRHRNGRRAHALTFCQPRFQLQIIRFISSCSPSTSTLSTSSRNKFSSKMQHSAHQIKCSTVHTKQVNFASSSN